MSQDTLTGEQLRRINEMRERAGMYSVSGDVAAVLWGAMSGEARESALRLIAESEFTGSLMPNEYRETVEDLASYWLSVAQNISSILFISSRKRNHEDDFGVLESSLGEMQSLVKKLKSLY